MVADDSSDDGGSRTDPDPPAEAATYTVNVDVDRVPSDENREPNNRCSEPGDGSAEPNNGSPKLSGCTANVEYLFIVRGENEAHAPGALGFPGARSRSRLARRASSNRPLAGRLARRSTSTSTTANA